MLEILKSTAWYISLVIIIYSCYFTVISLFSLLPQKKNEKFQPKNKFAVVIAARNEALVIGNLIESLQNQKYPNELFDIIVIPNNCTDDTRNVALSKGSKIFDCNRVIKSKGDALCEFFDSILENGNIYDGFCIFDADNVVAEDFIAEMNNALCRDIKVGQGYRDSKNPGDTAISGCYSIYYYMVNRFYNRARSILHLSAMINGSGFMVSSEIIQKEGGWHTETMTEDLEFTARCIIAGEKIHWIPEAVFYDEQPLTFAQSWKQRKRWSTGVIQCFELYTLRLIKNIVNKHGISNTISSFDLVMFFLAPFVQLLYTAVLIITGLFTLGNLSYFYFPQTDLFYRLFLKMDFSYIACLAISLFVILIERKNVLKLLKGIIAYWFFILSWLPINIICICKKQTEWIQIEHTRDIKINELPVKKIDNTSD